MEIDFYPKTWMWCIYFTVFRFTPGLSIRLWDLSEFCLFRIKVMSRDLQGFYVTVLELAILSLSLEIGYTEEVFFD